jgi:ferrochelatase
LRERLDLREEDVVVAFQSRVGREPWLKPYTDYALEAMPREGVKRVQVLCPGFAVDCLETLEEIAIPNRARFLRAGGERFDYLPALNAAPAHVAALAELVLKQTQGWPELDAGWDSARVAAQRATAQSRYQRLRDANR